MKQNQEFDLKFETKYIGGNERYPYLSLTGNEFMFLWKNVLKAEEDVIIPVGCIPMCNLIFMLEGVEEKYGTEFCKFLYNHEISHLMLDEDEFSSWDDVFLDTELIGYRNIKQEKRADAYACKITRTDTDVYKEYLSKMVDLINDCRPLYQKHYQYPEEKIPVVTMQTQIGNMSVDEFSQSVIELSKTL